MATMQTQVVAIQVVGLTQAVAVKEEQAEVVVAQAAVAVAS